MDTKSKHKFIYGSYMYHNRPWSSFYMIFKNDSVCDINILDFRGLGRGCSTCISFSLLTTQIEMSGHFWHHFWVQLPATADCERPWWWLNNKVSETNVGDADWVLCSSLWPGPSLVWCEPLKSESECKRSPFGFLPLM